MKLTDVQKFKISQAYSNSNEVLQQVKKKNLRGKELEDMKILESAVSSLEVIMIIAK